MRAQFCIYGPNQLNGPNIWLLRQIEGLRDHGITVEVLYMATDIHEPCGYLERLEKLNTKVIKVPYRFSLAQDVETILQIVAQDPPDVFVPNYVIGAYYAAGYLKAQGVTTLGVLHSDDPFYHKMAELFMLGASRWKLDGFVAVSAFLHEHFSPKAKDIELPLITYGAPLPKTAAQYNDSELRMYYFGRFVEEQKRVSRVIDRMTEAVKKSPRAKGVFYGAGTQELAMKAKIVELGAQKNISIGGKVPPEKIQEVMAQGQVFVLLSDYEGFSIAMMEAMAAGMVPVVARMRSGQEMLEDGVNSFIVDPDSPTEFAQAIAKLSTDRLLWEKMSKAARQTIVEAKLSSDACAKKWATWLKRLREGKETPTAFAPPGEYDIVIPVGPKTAEKIGRDHITSVWRTVMEMNEKGREVYIWGASTLGNLFFAQAKKLRLGISGAIDSNRAKHGMIFNGVGVFGPEKLSQSTQRPYVVVTSQFYREIAIVLDGLGYQEHVDYRGR